MKPIHPSNVGPIGPGLGFGGYGAPKRKPSPKRKATPKPKPKERTIRAWAVVNAQGMAQGMLNGVWKNRSLAVISARTCADHFGARFAVVPLTGVWKVKVRK